MEKKTISVHAFTVHIYTIAIVVLILLLGVLGLIYIHLKLAVDQYTYSAMWQQMHTSPSGSIGDYAKIISTTIGQYPQTQPLYTQPLQLESLVGTLSKNLNRDIVVVDRSQKILADTVVANMGSKYSYDRNNEIGKTLTDGISRTFVETSPDYPSGLSVIVEPINGDKGDIVGAVLVSNSQVTN